MQKNEAQNAENGSERTGKFMMPKDEVKNQTSRARCHAGACSISAACYGFRGDLEVLLNGVRKSCGKMALVLKNEAVNTNGFSLTVSQKTNWLSTNWPMKFVITAESVGDTYALIISGSSSLGSLTQSSNNSAKAQELLSLIKVFAPSR